MSQDGGFDLFGECSAGRDAEAGVFVVARSRVGPGLLSRSGARSFGTLAMDLSADFGMCGVCSADADADADGGMLAVAVWSRELLVKRGGTSEKDGGVKGSRPA
ncbi:hypothetical protein K432DRAFT_410295 [Lepidopterella palustris CBS 459.81]|uniref:Uncharacterized protein n=1 Tax=Lepidopterella palustris CBS 459.81 TaxID=1314670 RepID=A0A8E2J950_9PEZI|nr:hypothetical protein K432DRAFT_410295 [Lepidopterella palustris CBS 459.81]